MVFFEPRQVQLHPKTMRNSPEMMQSARTSLQH